MACAPTPHIEKKVPKKGDENTAVVVSFPDFVGKIEKKVPKKGDENVTAM